MTPLEQARAAVVDGMRTTIRDLLSQLFARRGVLLINDDETGELLVRLVFPADVMAIIECASRGDDPCAMPQLARLGHAPRHGFTIAVLSDGLEVARKRFAMRGDVLVEE